MAESEEPAETPTAQDIERADALAQVDPLLNQLWNAGEYDADQVGRENA